MSYRRGIFIKNASKFLELAEDNLIVINMEKGIFNLTIEICKKNNFDLKWSDTNFLKLYSKEARRILANISYTPNSIEFKSRILSNEILPYEVCRYTKEDMYPEFWKEVKDAYVPEHVKNPKEKPDGMIKCRKCKSMKTDYYQLQTRSADEPMTTYVTCHNCEHRWKF
jgi:DNA-directed RNA polymerase subunit M/transcription elongation factor TFIIS